MMRSVAKAITASVTLSVPASCALLAQKLNLGEGAKPMAWSGTLICDDGESAHHCVVCCECMYVCMYRCMNR